MVPIARTWLRWANQALSETPWKAWECVGGGRRGRRGEGGQRIKPNQSGEENRDIFCCDQP